MPAQATANSVIASEKRLMDVRQSCFKRNRMAEISVPAWPIPIHQTKLIIAKPQPMGMLMPQMPTPLQKQPAARQHQQVHKAESDECADQPLLGRIL